MMFAKLIQDLRLAQDYVDRPAPLHAPVFKGREREYVLDALESTFVSSVGEYVDRLERMLEEITGARRAVACVNGTAALEIALRLADVKNGNLVLTQSLTFVATANAIIHAGGTPVFLDIEESSLGMDPQALENFLEMRCVKRNGRCIYRESGQLVVACVPMHSFGLPCRIRDLATLCRDWNIVLVEDAAEALGSLSEGIHCGVFGRMGALSFNGNKIITTGGGGAVLAMDEELGRQLRHLTTTAKIPHPWEYRHDSVAWNYRMPNLNAALGCAQLEQLPLFLEIKRERARRYTELFSTTPWTFVTEPVGCRSNYWLCAVLFRDRRERDAFLAETHQAKVMTRPVWEPMHTLPMYSSCLHDGLKITRRIANCLVNLPSGI